MLTLVGGGSPTKSVYNVHTFKPKNEYIGYFSGKGSLLKGGLAALQYWGSKDHKTGKAFQDKGQKYGMPHMEESQDQWLKSILQDLVSWGHIHAMQKNGVSRVKKIQLELSCWWVKYYLRICTYLTTCMYGSLWSDCGVERNRWCMEEERGEQPEIKSHRWNDKSEKCQVYWEKCRNDVCPLALVPNKTLVHVRFLVWSE